MPARTYMGVEPPGPQPPRPAAGPVGHAGHAERVRAAAATARPSGRPTDRGLGWDTPGRAADFARALDAARRGFRRRSGADRPRRRSEPAGIRVPRLSHFPELSAPAMAAPLEQRPPRCGTPWSPWARSGASTPCRPIGGERGRPLLRDPVKAVRLAAAQALAGAPLAQEQRAELDRVVDGAGPVRAGQRDGPAHLNLANISARRGRPPDAESELGTALSLDRRLRSASVDLADLMQARP